MSFNVLDAMLRRYAAVGLTVAEAGGLGMLAIAYSWCLVYEYWRIGCCDGSGRD